MCKPLPRLPLFCLAFLTIIGGAPIDARSQTVRGVVTDAETGEPLERANVHVEGTYRGTTTNDRGRYRIEVDSLPATLVVRYIGYETVGRRLTPDSEVRQDFVLSPSAVELDQVVVTDDRNPGRSIMKKVIEQKQTWWDSLRTYQVTAHSRYTVSNDTSIVAIFETQAKTYWDRERGRREVVQSKRRTRNMDFVAGAPPAAASVLNLYRDNVEIAGTSLRGVTHPQALDHYSFVLDTTRVLGGQRVYDIRVEPQSHLTSAFRGQVSILDSTYAMIEARLRPAQSLRLPRIVEEKSLLYEQKFSNFGGPYWLPVDFRREEMYKPELSALLTFPRLYLTQVSRFGAYNVNVSLPDSLYRPDANVIAEPAGLNWSEPRPDSLARDSLAGSGPFVPLSDEEERAYAEIDSSDSVVDAFEPGGLLSGLLDLRAMEGGLSLDSGEPDADSSEGGDSGGMWSSIDVSWPTPTLWYNRVEGSHVGGTIQVGLGDGLTVRGRGGHSFNVDGPVRWSYGAGANVDVSTTWVETLSVEYRYGVDRRYESDARLFPPLTRGINSLWTLSGEPDYYDYFGNERVHIGLSGRLPGLGANARFEVRNERQFSVLDRTDFDLFGRDVRQPANPPIDRGILRSAALQLQWGDGPGLLGVLPVNRIQVDAEHSLGAFDSDFDFTRVEVAADARVETFFRRRLLPMTLDLRMEAASTVGTLPLQRFGVVEASPLPYTPFGSLRTLDDRPYQGSEHAALFWEHNFRTIPFEWLGLFGVADRHIEVLLHGGHGRTWMDHERIQSLRRRGTVLRTSDGFHHEMGFSINGLLRDLIRLDFTARLDRSAYSVGVSLLRFI